MKKEHVLARLKEDCLVAVIRAKNYEQGEKVVDAVIAGGINFIELTMTMDDGDPVGFIKKMADKYKDNDKIVIGAGTVLDPETARACILAGANYIVSPGLNVETIKLCNRYRVPMLPGVMTPSDRYGSWMRCNQDFPRKYRRTCSYQLFQGTSATG